MEIYHYYLIDNVDIVYNYNNTIKEKMDYFIKNFPSNIEYFNVRDLELINYWVNNVGKMKLNL